MYWECPKCGKENATEDGDSCTCGHIYNIYDNNKIAFEEYLEKLHCSQTSFNELARAYYEHKKHCIDKQKITNLLKKIEVREHYSIYEANEMSVTYTTKELIEELEKELGL